MTKYPFILGNLSHQLQDWYMSGFSRAMDHEILLVSPELNEEAKRRWEAFHKLATVLRMTHEMTGNLLRELDEFDGNLYIPKEEATAKSE